MKIEVVGSSITVNQFILDVLNNMTLDYKLQLEMLEKSMLW
jgi:hypothetical protein